jgi:predicted lipid-binding transport protein (Tim44 family)
MKRILLSMFIAALSLGFAATSVQAKRLGGGASQGMKRPITPRQQAPEAPAQQQQAAPARQNAAPATPNPAAAPAPAPRRSWLGPIAGIAAGLGIAALMSHFGLGAAMGNILTTVLLVLVAFFVVRWLLRRFAPSAARQGLQYAGAGAGAGSGAGATPAANDTATWRSASSSVEPGFTPSPVVQPVGSSVPAGVDTAALERAAKMIFIRMQAANDAGDLNDLRQFSTPEMFAAFSLDLQDRQSARQRTDVVQLDAQVLDWAEEAGQQIVSVRFHGLIREEADGTAAPFDEVWHLVRPTDGSREWAIAGIAQSVVAG